MISAVPVRNAAARAARRNKACVNTASFRLLAPVAIKAIERGTAGAIHAAQNEWPGSCINWVHHAIFFVSIQRQNGQLRAGKTLRQKRIAFFSRDQYGIIAVYFGCERYAIQNTGLWFGASGNAQRVNHRLRG